MNLSQPVSSIYSSRVYDRKQPKAHVTDVKRTNMGLEFLFWKREMTRLLSVVFGVDNQGMAWCHLSWDLWFCDIGNKVLGLIPNHNLQHLGNKFCVSP